MKYFLILFLLFTELNVNAQPDRWQQRVAYRMDVDVNVHNNTFSGTTYLKYYNNSPDTLRKAFFHLYWNAFRPGSMMDERSLAAGKDSVNGKPDWDPRVRDRISKLKEDEMGWMHVSLLMMNGHEQKCELKSDGTIMEVQLSQPILPHQFAVFEMEFSAQVPLQIRRSGRDNPQTGVQYSMSQWYPKICEYDYEGWHPTPYVAREFYGVWGDYDVTIHIDDRYKLGASGVLQNANEIGWGYDKPGTELKPLRADTNIRTWHFIADSVHDFVWAADTGYKHLVRITSDGITLHTIYKYKPGDTLNEKTWLRVADVTGQVLPFMEKTFGQYAYPQYSFIQGGDGGMEYPMATLIATSSMGTVFHEWMHSWYQMMLATNESEYPWMDEGFTEYASERVNNYYYTHILKKELTQNHNSTGTHWLDSVMQQLPEIFAGSYKAYFALAKSGLEEPLTTHADHYNTNYAYNYSSYSKGCIFLAQLGYIVGEATLDKILLEYYNQWKFKHPNANDFMVIAQKVSGLQLDWYKEYWINTTKHIDYGIDSVWQNGDSIAIRLKRIGQMPMPVDITVQFRNRKKELYNIPIDLMFGNKTGDAATGEFTVKKEWNWTNPTYTLLIKGNINKLSLIEIDPSQRLADVDRSNNRYAVKVTASSIAN